MMELGVGMFGDVRLAGNVTPNLAQQRLNEMVAEIKLMDEVGLDFFGIGEHHRPDYAVSAPEIVMAAASTVTNNIQLGSAVSVLSSTEPVRLYQQYATVDLLSNGRAEITVGRGSFIESFPLFGYDLKDYDALFEEKLDLLLALNKGGAVNWKGRFRAALHQQEVFPKPTGNGLDVWVAVGGTPQSVQRAARLGLPVIFAIIGGSPAAFKPLFNYYRELYQAQGHPVANMRTGVHMHALFGADSRRLAENYYPLYAAQMNRIGRERGWQPYQPWQFEQGRSPQGHLLIGDASEAVDKILQLHQTLGFTRFAAHMDVGAPDHATLMKSIEIYGTQVAPKVRQALKGS